MNETNLDTSKTASLSLLSQSVLQLSRFTCSLIVRCSLNLPQSRFFLQLIYSNVESLRALLRALRKFEKKNSHGLTKWRPEAFPFEIVRLEAEVKNKTEQNVKTMFVTQFQRNQIQLLILAFGCHLVPENFLFVSQLLSKLLFPGELPIKWALEHPKSVPKYQFLVQLTFGSWQFSKLVILVSE